ncbi:hyp1 protein [Fusarium langsethiae]|uniref:Hyp1 protein n=1 Tax=Fusarium langsethiae TaxID=179993 RepID=A0A0M9EPP5_FUSLA|nr:hyp1 protein [Fusarium langsethiae]GKU06893.1 unnamed protein product [Fusarium langsethiae]
MREEDNSLFTRIRRFYFCLLRYIQDYMMKATSYYLPRAYCMLPLLSQDGTCFKDEYLESDFDLGSFGMVGRRRLFWAFLRYELMSRIRLYKATVDSSYTPPLYAAHYARWDGIRLPNDRTAADPSHLSCPPGLRPDHHSFQRVDLIAFQARKWSVSEWFMERLEEYGFGILTDLTYDAKKAKKDRQGPELLWNFLHKLKYLNYGEPGDVHRACATTLWEDTKNGRNVPDLCARAIWQRGRPTAEAWDFYRQRVWVFFDDARVHTQHSALVSLPEIPMSPDHSDSEYDSVTTCKVVKGACVVHEYLQAPQSNVNELSLASQRINRQISHLRAITMSLEMIMMEVDEKGKRKCSGDAAIKPDSGKSLEVQLVLSLAIGISAFFLFCFLRPRWPALYAARKQRLDHRLGLPTLPNSTFGWIPAFYRITEEQVLASAGLDAFVFLSFFKMAIRLFVVMAFLATLILWPINRIYEGFRLPVGGKPDDQAISLDAFYDNPSYIDVLKDKHDGEDKSWTKTWMWAYVFFTYFFVGLTIYYLNLETNRIIKFRQDYLGSQSTVTDRTFRLTGIPEDLRSEEAIKNLIEKLEIGTVDKVMICRDWKKLDDLMDARDTALRGLEGAWATFLKQQRQKRKGSGSQERLGNGVSQNSLQDEGDNEAAGENGRLLDSEQQPWDSEDEGRPKVNIRYGTLGLRSRNVDAIDYYEERLRRLDAQVTEARKKSYTPTDMAIVTMDSVASCQMAIQARIDPRPGRLLTKLTPAPSDLVWRNTYAPRGIRRLRSWTVTILITVVTLVFITPTAFLAGLLTPCAINEAAPAVGKWLRDHTIIYSLASNGLPALVVSLLNVAVPYLYDFLSNQQGMISQGDVELSVISKNYFFTFFNTFFVFAVSKSGLAWWSELQKFAKDTSQIPKAIANDVEELAIFYTCFIMLQGIGLMPFRILEAGSVFLYPFLQWLSKTPRDALELKKPPVFQYGFFLPTSLLVFNLCIIYSVLNLGFIILIIGLIYFVLGYYAFKYMVLYAMDQPQHATGGAWRIICYRIIVGLLVFELVMVGRIATGEAFIQSVCILPLIPFSVWYSYYIKRRYEPLTKYIALRAIRADEDSDDAAAMDDAFEDENITRPSQTLLRRGSTLDEYKEKGTQFVNPSLVAPLPQPWIYDEPPPPIVTDDTQSTQESQRPILQGVDSTLGIGDENVWRDNGGNNV